MKKVLISLLLLVSTAFIFAESTDVYMMQPDGGLYLDEDDGSIKYTTSVSLGTKLPVLTIKDENGKTVLDEKDTTRPSSGKMIKCHVYHVSYKDNKYWVLSDRISFEKNFAIITKESAIYEAPDYAEASGKTLPAGTVITYTQQEYFPRNTNVTTGAGAFNKVQYFDENAWVTKTVYIRSNRYAYSKDDLKAIQLISKIKDTKDEKVKAELIKNAKSLSVSEGLKPQIEEL